MWKRACLLLLLGSTACADEGPVPPTPCERLREHLIDLRMSYTRGVDVDKHKVALRQAMGPSFLASCKKDMTASQIGCALAATDSNAITQCVTAKKEIQ